MFSRLRNAITAVLLVARQVAGSLRANWGIGVLSLVLAVSLWVYVTDRENPDSVGRVPGSVPIEIVNVPPGQAVLSISSDSVSVRARASESALEGLAAEDFRATVDLAGMTEQQATVGVSVESQESRATVEEVSPAQVRVVLENVTSRSVRVTPHLVGAPRRGSEVDEINIEPEEAVVSGPESLVAGVESVEADINLAPVAVTFDQTVLLQARGEGGATIEGVNVEPESAVVRVEIVQVDVTVDFIVRPDISGVPADGYNVTSVQVEPAVVSISGPVSVIETLDAVTGITTETVSIGGADDDVIHTVAVKIPEGVRIEEPAVTVRIVIEPAIGQFSFSLVPELRNKSPTLFAEATPPSVQVVLEGPAPDLQGLALSDIAVTLDLEGLKAGSHKVAVRVTVPQGATLVSVTPTEVTVELTEP